MKGNNIKKGAIFFTLLFIGLVFLFNVNALIASSGSYYDLPIRSCVLENNSVIQNNYTISCVGTYPSTCSTNDKIGCDDSKEENVSYTINHFGGIYIQVGNTSINNCGSVGDVFLCYKWKTSGGTSADCLVAVDADGNASWTNVSTACPGTSEPASATCVNVTANESWTCSNFFDTVGTKAVARNEISRSNGGMSRLANNVLFFNITWYLETVNPSEINLINPNNNTINASSNWTFEANASDNVELANATLYTNISGSWVKNQTNTTIGSGNVTTFNVNNINNGGYIWNVEWCDTSNNCAQAPVNFTFIMNLAPSDINLINPGNETSNESDNRLFESNASDDRGLANATLYTNISGSWERNQTADMSGTTNTTTFAVYNITSGSYIWNVEWCDSNNVCSQAASNFTFIVNSTSNNSSNNGTSNSSGSGGSGGGASSSSSSSGGISSAERAARTSASAPAPSAPSPSPSPAPSAPTQTASSPITGAAINTPTGQAIKVEETSVKANKVVSLIIVGVIMLLLITAMGIMIYQHRKALKGKTKK